MFTRLYYPIHPISISPSSSYFIILKPLNPPHPRQRNPNTPLPTTLPPPLTRLSPKPNIAPISRATAIKLATIPVSSFERPRMTGLFKPFRKQDADGCPGCGDEEGEDDEVHRVRSRRRPE